MPWAPNNIEASIVHLSTRGVKEFCARQSKQFTVWKELSVFGMGCVYRGYTCRKHTHSQVGDNRALAEWSTLSGLCYLLWSSPKTDGLNWDIQCIMWPPFEGIQVGHVEVTTLHQTPASAATECHLNSPSTNTALHCTCGHTHWNHTSGISIAWLQYRELNVARTL